MTFEDNTRGSDFSTEEELWLEIGGVSSDLLDCLGIKPFDVVLIRFDCAHLWLSSCLLRLVPTLTSAADEDDGNHVVQVHPFLFHCLTQALDSPSFDDSISDGNSQSTQSVQLQPMLLPSTMCLDPVSTYNDKNWDVTVVEM